MTIFERTKVLAAERNISLAKLAIESGLTKNAIYRWRDSTPLERSLISVAKTLNVSIEFLKGETTDPTPMSLTNTSLRQAVDLDYLDHYDVRYKGKELSEEDVELIKSVVEPLLKRLTSK